VPIEVERFEALRRLAVELGIDADLVVEAVA
jgi:hypothetical protein